MNLKFLHRIFCLGKQATSTEILIALFEIAHQYARWYYSANSGNSFDPSAQEIDDKILAWLSEKLKIKFEPKICSECGELIERTSGLFRPFNENYCYTCSKEIFEGAIGCEES